MQVRFGARSGAAPIFLGMVKIALALLFGDSLFRLLRAFPRPLLGSMLVFSGAYSVTMHCSLTTLKRSYAYDFTLRIQPAVRVLVGHRLSFAGSSGVCEQVGVCMAGVELASNCRGVTSERGMAFMLLTAAAAAVLLLTRLSPLYLLAAGAALGLTGLL